MNLSGSIVIISRAIPDKGRILTTDRDRILMIDRGRMSMTDRGRMSTTDRDRRSTTDKGGIRTTGSGSIPIKGSGVNTRRNGRIMTANGENMKGTGIGGKFMRVNGMIGTSGIMIMEMMDSANFYSVRS
jgi:hypothetical protein